jgi:hypothetical protein
MSTVNDPNINHKTGALLTLAIAVAKKSYIFLLICLACSLVVIVVGSRWHRRTGRCESAHEVAVAAAVAASR